MSIIPKKYIKKIKYGILSDKKRIKLANGRRITKYTGHEFGRVEKGSLYDPLMGTVKTGNCESCFLSWKSCPGHPGIINLKVPVINPLFIKPVYGVLQATCFRCGSILIKKEDRPKVLKKRKKDRLKLCITYANRIRTCFSCDFSMYDNKISYKITSSFDIRFKTATTPLKILSPEVIYERFSNLRKVDIDLLGFNSKRSHPKDMIMNSIYVIPPSIRPITFGIGADGNKSEDGLFKLYHMIVKSNSKIPDSPDEDKYRIDIDTLKMAITSLLTDKASSKKEHSLTFIGGGSKATKSMKERLSGKYGYFRRHLLGKRLNWSARTVISGDSKMEIDEFGIPLTMAKKLCKKIFVNKRNIEFLKQLIKNGPNVWPGAVYIQKSGSKYKIPITDSTKKKLLDELDSNDIVYRHLIDGDIALFNRQPTLHKISINAHKIKIFPNHHTMRLHNCATKPYNADFDGDEMNMYIISSQYSIAEAIELMSVKERLINEINSSPVIIPIQDNILGIYLITKNYNLKLSKFEFSIILSAAESYHLNILERGKTEYEAINLLESIIPKDFTYQIGSLVFNSGRWVSGTIGSKETRSIIKYMVHLYGPDNTMRFMKSLQRMSDRFLMIFGTTISINDCVIDKNVKKQMIENIKVADRQNDELINKFDEKKITIPITQTPREAFEAGARAIIGDCSKKNQKLLTKALKKEGNKFVDQYESGSRGKPFNVYQIFDSLGQQDMEGERIDHSYGSRTLPYFTKMDNSLESRGFVKKSFYEGLDPIGYLYHAMSARNGVIDTALKTAKTGYIEREASNIQQSIMVSYDNLVRHANESIISFSYGSNNYDNTKLHRNKLLIKNLSDSEFDDLYVI